MGNRASEPSTVGSSTPPGVIETELQLLHPYGVGIDVHSKFIQVAVIWHEGRVLKLREWEVPANSEAMFQAKLQVVHHLRSLDLPVVDSDEAQVLEKHGDNLRYCLESTGTYHFPVMKAFGGKPAVVNPLLANPSRRKTDVLDARLLAQHSMAGMWPESFLPSSDVQALRALMSTRTRTVREKTRLSNAIRSQLRMFGMADCEAGRVSSPGCRRIVEQVIAGEALPGCDEELPGAARLSLAMLLDGWRATDKAVKELLPALRGAVRSQEFLLGTGDKMNGREFVKLLATVPGVGEILAIAWCAAIVNVQRFGNNVKRLQAYAGVDPSIKVSAGKATSFAKRKGCEKLHAMLSRAAMVVISHRSSKLGIWGYSLSRRTGKGSWRKAVAAVSRRMAGFMFHVQRTGTPYNPDAYTFWDAPDVVDKHVLDVFSAATSARLLRTGVSTTREAAAAHAEGWVGQRGCGAVTRLEVEEWLKKNRRMPAPKRLN